MTIAVLASCGSPTPQPATPTPGTVPEWNGIVERVVDGDTVDIVIDGRSERVRLIGIDTPETVKPNSPVECFGPEASSFTRALLPDGTKVLVVRDVEPRDDYGRLLAYVHRANDGVFVNLELVRAGYAALLTFPPNVAHVDDFVAAARAAERADLGLWSACSG